MTTKVHGVSMHFYDERANSDKFYRMFVCDMNNGHGNWAFVKVWGRAGQAGTARVEYCGDEQLARHKLTRKTNEQRNKGYQLLGEDIVRSPLPLVDPISSAQKLHDRIGREPIKMPAGYVFIIREEEFIEDLIDVA